MNLSVGLMEGVESVRVELLGTFTDAADQTYAAGRYNLESEITLIPSAPEASFAIEDVVIGIGFHWERKERQVFRGDLRILKRESLTVINDVSLEEYVTSVISSEMSASCPLELLKAHAVISRSWLWFPKMASVLVTQGIPETATDGSHEIRRWYGREAHPDFDVCADDHCQRYQGITKTFSAAASQAVAATKSEFLVYEVVVCDARFSKSCGGITELYSTAWEDCDIPYLKSIYDGPRQSCSYSPESLIRADVPAYCNTRDKNLLSRILPGFDQETLDFYRWRV